jgi:hypothetical protein
MASNEKKVLFYSQYLCWEGTNQGLGSGCYFKELSHYGELSLAYIRIIVVYGDQELGIN